MTIERSQRYVRMMAGGRVHGQAKKEKKDANLKKKILRNKTRSLIKQRTQQNEQEVGETIKMKRAQDIWGGLAGQLKRESIAKRD